MALAHTLIEDSNLNGGAVGAWHGNVDAYNLTVRNCGVLDPSADGGGGWLTSLSNLTCTLCTFQDNRGGASGEGGAISMLEAGYATVRPRSRASAPLFPPLFFQLTEADTMHCNGAPPAPAVHGVQVPQQHRRHRRGHSVLRRLHGALDRGQRVRGKLRLGRLRRGARGALRPPREHLAHELRGEPGPRRRRGRVLPRDGPARALRGQGRDDRPLGRPQRRPDRREDSAGLQLQLGHRRARSPRCPASLRAPALAVPVHAVLESSSCDPDRVPCPRVVKTGSPNNVVQGCVIELRLHIISMEPST